MSRYVLELPEHASEVLGVDAAQLMEHTRLAAAMKFYELGQLSTGAAAEFAGIGVLEFQDRMAEFGVLTCMHSADEFEEDLRNARSS